MQSKSLSDREKAVRLKLRDDFAHYADKVLKIRTKDGTVIPFAFNKAQRYIHSKLEEQKATTGKVRALILKGRQQGCCHAPETLVMTSTYEWKEIGDVSPGERLLAFDEECQGQTARGYTNSRRFRTTTVEAVVRLNRPRVRIELDNGAVLITTPEHRYLSKQRGGCQPQWRTVDSCREGDVLRVITPPPPRGEIKDAAWLAGIFDGEGSIRRNGTVRLSFSQRQGDILERGRRTLAALGVAAGEVIDARGAGDSSKLGSEPVHRLDVHRQSDVLHVLSQCPTTRFREEGLFDGHELPGKRADGGKAWAKIVSLTHLGEGPVVDLQTEHKTFIAEGIASHNSTYVGGRFYHQTTHRRGVRTFILTHEDAATQNLFEMVNRYHEHCNPLVKPSTGAANAKELFFDKLDSGYKVGTAGTKGVGRSSTIQLFHGCLSPDSWIIDGKTSAARRMGDFELGDLVVTHTGKAAPVSFISHQEKDAFSIKMKGIGDRLIATGEHRFWTDSGWKELCEITVGDCIGYPVAEVVDGGVVWPYRLPNSHRPQGGGSAEVGPDTVRPTYPLGRILGLFLAEGTIIKQSGSDSFSAVSFAVHEREVERTVEWLGQCSDLFRSVKVTSRKDSKTVTVTAYGRSFATFVHSLCGRTDSKRLPSDWRICGKEFVRGLVHGYLAGDGHSSKRPGDRRISAPSVRSAITVGMRDALASLGYGWACIARAEAAVRHGRNEREQWTLRLCGKGVDRLCEELGWEMPPRKRSGDYRDVAVSEGYAWVPVVEISHVGTVPVMDFEVDDEDHSYCAVQGATHNSEAAFWPNAETHAAGVLQAVPDMAGTEVILESTANGVGNFFHQRWRDAEQLGSDFIAIFVPWFWQEEYRKEVPEGFLDTLTDDEIDYGNAYDLDPEQLAWRRAKIAELRDPILFKQEYPATAAEAFQMSGHDSYIKPELVVKARKETHEGYGPLVVGFDPAWTGADRSAMAWRRGRQLIKVEAQQGLDTMQSAGWCKQVIDRDNPARLFIDVGGVGAGVYDRLCEMGYRRKVVPVNFGGSPLEPSVDGGGPLNRRAEIWMRSKEWLEDPAGVDIPDSDELQADAVGPSFKYDSMTRLLIEKKEDMRKRGVKSPDLWDAVALTFSEYLPPHFTEEEERDRYKRPVQRGSSGSSQSWQSA